MVKRLMWSGPARRRRRAREHRSPTAPRRSSGGACSTRSRPSERELRRRPARRPASDAAEHRHGDHRGLRTRHACSSAKRSSSPRPRSSRRATKLRQGRGRRRRRRDLLRASRSCSRSSAAPGCSTTTCPATTSPTSGASSRWPLILLVLGVDRRPDRGARRQTRRPADARHGDRGGAEDPRDRKDSSLMRAAKTLREVRVVVLPLS